jgi:hypothetical protein
VPAYRFDDRHAPVDQLVAEVEHLADARTA